MPDHGLETATASCCRPSSKSFMGNNSKASNHKSNFLTDKVIWIKASKNTLNCLVGCSIGDFGMLIFLNSHYPSTPLWLIMVLAMSAGLLTSIILETIVLKIKERFSWHLAFTTAFSMSFISMLGMELSENATDFFLTKGVVPLNDPWYWWALAISLLVGFLAPLPYNYYKLKKHGQACH